MSVSAFSSSTIPEVFEVESFAPVPNRSLARVRRRGSVDQGRALESLGHAVEYLVDSRLFQTGDVNQRSEQEAVQILMRMSRAVFAECPEVISIQTRLRRWLKGRLLPTMRHEQRG